MTITKSYQDCTEVDVPGYNDCPSFLFMRRKTSSNRRQRRIVSDHLHFNDAASPTGNPPSTMAATPPIIHRKHNEIATARENAYDVSLNKEEILQRVNELYNLESSLVVREFDFYRRKVNDNLINSLESDLTRSVMTRFFKVAQDDKMKASNILRDWMASDVNVISWCPAFLKIFEHTEDSQTVTTQ